MSPDDSREGITVDVVNLSWRERPAGFDDFVPGRQDGDARPREDLQLDDAAGGERADAARVENGSRIGNRPAGGDVGAAPADVLARIDGRRDPNLIAARAFRFLDHDDGVGAGGHRGAGGNLDALAAADRA
jgi:hypothetical protein